MTSDEIVRAVIDAAIGNVHDKMILAIIARHANADGVCWPSRHRLADLAGVSPMTVVRSIRSLVGNGYISRNFGDHITPTYKVNLEKLALAADGQTSVPAAKAEPTPESKAPAVAEEPKKTRTVFRPPTLEEVAAYCREQGWAWDPAKFHDHHTARGWRLGRESMKDWKAAARTWNRNEQTYSRRPSVTAPRVSTGVILRAGDSEKACASIDTAKLDEEVNRILGFKS